MGERGGPRETEKWGCIFIRVTFPSGSQQEAQRKQSENEKSCRNEEGRRAMERKTLALHLLDTDRI